MKNAESAIALFLRGRRGLERSAPSHSRIFFLSLSSENVLIEFSFTQSKVVKWFPNVIAERAEITSTISHENSEMHLSAA